MVEGSRLGDAFGQFMLGVLLHRSGSKSDAAQWMQCAVAQGFPVSRRIEHVKRINAKAVHGSCFTGERSMSGSDGGKCTRFSGKNRRLGWRFSEDR